MKKFSYQDQFGNRYYDCFFKVGQYSNGNIAIELYGVPAEEPGCPEPIMTVSVNIGKFNPETVAIKNYAENTGILELLSELNIIINVSTIVYYGRVEIPICELNLEELKEYSQ